MIERHGRGEQPLPPVVSRAQRLERRGRERRDRRPESPRNCPFRAASFVETVESRLFLSCLELDFKLEGPRE